MGLDLIADLQVIDVSQWHTYTLSATFKRSVWRINLMEFTVILLCTNVKRYLSFRGNLYSEAGFLVIYVRTNASLNLNEVFLLLEYNPEVPVLLWLYTLAVKCI